VTDEEVRIIRAHRRRTADRGVRRGPLMAPALGAMIAYDGVTRTESVEIPQVIQL
jgi:hypothetical protein